MRDIDIDAVDKLRKMPGVTVLDRPDEITGIIKNLVETKKSNSWNNPYPRNIMEPVERSEGISGMLTTFRKLARGSRKITFIGCPGWCNPFAELLGYVLRDAGKEMVFIPNLRKDLAARVEMTDYGMQLGEKADPAADTVVLLGGLAMPGIGVDIGGLQRLMDEITDGNPDRKILGVCIGGIFQKAGWDKQIDFDYLVDADMEITTYSFE
jgi:hypothetical protein